MRKIILSAVFLGIAFTACGAPDIGAADGAAGAATSAKTEGLSKATFAGGCFWCMEPPFDKLDGVHSTTSGYTAGEQKNPTYRQVSAGVTGHTEAVQILFDPEKISYAELVDVFWRNIDPLAVDRQFCDGGTQYRTGIYYHDEEQQRLAEETRAEVAKRFDQPIATEIEAAAEFYPAEDYHQDYYKKNPVRYKMYRTGCGRDRRLQELWGD
ncbi:MAG: peptide-methionine (S)-S-oxide reductase MsrA [bacterium]|nr:peptide-methionine (S)-S-oxide reductase MsrA [bacterium]